MHQWQILRILIINSEDISSQHLFFFRSDETTISLTSESTFWSAFYLYFSRQKQTFALKEVYSKDLPLLFCTFEPWPPFHIYSLWRSVGCCSDCFLLSCCVVFLHKLLLQYSWSRWNPDYLSDISWIDGLKICTTLKNLPRKCYICLQIIIFICCPQSC